MACLKSFYSWITIIPWLWESRVLPNQVVPSVIQLINNFLVALDLFNSFNVIIWKKTVYGLFPVLIRLHWINVWIENSWILETQGKEVVRPLRGSIAWTWIVCWFGCVVASRLGSDQHIQIYADFHICHDSKKLWLCILYFKKAGVSILYKIYLWEYSLQ